jgi:hypothetical protein
VSRRPRRGRLPAPGRIAVPALAVTRAPTGVGTVTVTGIRMAGGTAGTRMVGTITASTVITAGND